MPDFASVPLWVNVALLAASAAAVWWAGTRLSRAWSPGPAASPPGRWRAHRSISRTSCAGIGLNTIGVAIVYLGGVYLLWTLR